MAYNYLIDLYVHIEKQLTSLRNEAASGLASEEEKAYARGQTDVYCELEEFLKTNYNKMLPAKIRRRLEEEGPHGIN